MESINGFSLYMRSSFTHSITCNCPTRCSLLCCLLIKVKLVIRSNGRTDATRTIAGCMRRGCRIMRWEGGLVQVAGLPLECMHTTYTVQCSASNVRSYNYKLFGRVELKLQPAAAPSSANTTNRHKRERLH